jgi:hypothetical protein
MEIEGKKSKRAMTGIHLGHGPLHALFSKKKIVLDSFLWRWESAEKLVMEARTCASSQAYPQPLPLNKEGASTIQLLGNGVSPGLIALHFPASTESGQAPPLFS